MVCPQAGRKRFEFYLLRDGDSMALLFDVNPLLFPLFSAFSLVVSLAVDKSSLSMQEIVGEHFADRDRSILSAGYQPFNFASPRLTAPDISVPETVLNILLG